MKSNLGILSAAALYIAVDLTTDYRRRKNCK